MLYTPGNENRIVQASVKDHGDVKSVLITRDDKRVIILADRGGKLAILGATKDDIEECKPGAQNVSLTELDIRGSLEYVPGRGDRACLLEMQGAVLFLLLSQPRKRKSFSVNLASLFHSE